MTFKRPAKLCEHCGRYESDALGMGSTHCNPPFVVQRHLFSVNHPYLFDEFPYSETDYRSAEI